MYSGNVSGVAQPHSTAERLGDRLEFETLISDLSSRIISLPPGEVDREIEEALRRTCALVGIDLAVLWQWSSAAPGVVISTHAYCADEAWRPSEAMGEDQYPWLVQQALAGRMFAAACLEDFPPEAAVDRETLRQYGVKSGVSLPLAAGGEPPIGVLGLNVMREERDWPDALLRRLRLVAQVFTDALLRRRHEVSLPESEELSRGTFELHMAVVPDDWGERGQTGLDRVRIPLARHRLLDRREHDALQVRRARAGSGAGLRVRIVTLSTWHREAARACAR